MRKHVAFWVVLMVALVLLAVALTDDATNGPEFDPRSTSPSGTRALIELIERFGADVTQRPVDVETLDVEGTTLLVVRDVYDGDQRADVEAWVRRGGRLVLIDDRSPLNPLPAGSEPPGTLSRGVCDMEGFDDVQELSLDWSFTRLAVSDRSCFGDGDSAVVLSETVGRGESVTLGEPLLVTNEFIGRADNAVLAVRLLRAERTEHVVVVFDPLHAVGTETLGDLIGSNVRWFGVQLLVAFGLFVAWRSRRFGAVVDEPQLVTIPGSMQVRAAGVLRQRAGAAAEAAALLRADLDRRVRRHHRLPPEVDLAPLLDRVAEESGIARQRFDDVLGATTVAASEEELAQLVVAIDTISPVLVPRFEEHHD